MCSRYEAARPAVEGYTSTRSACRQLSEGFSHIGLINTARNLSRAGGPAEEDCHGLIRGPADAMKFSSSQIAYLMAITRRAPTWARW